MTGAHRRDPDPEAETPTTGPTGPTIGPTPTPTTGPAAGPDPAPGVADEPTSEPAAPTADRARRPYATAALFVLPYLILMVAWAGSNPPGSAPDEPDHLVKALGVARLHIGTAFHGTVPDSARGVQKRNASISRVVPIPARLAPDGYRCTAFHPERTAACLPDRPAHRTGTVRRTTPMGSYPPFLYLPIGLLAHAMNTPTTAFLAGRLAGVAMAGLLLFFGAAHLVRWLGRRALLGAFIGLTPMALFASSMVSTSGVEICGAFALAAVAVVAVGRRESLLAPATQFTLAGSGAALILSRQLGSVTFSALIVLMVLRIGLPAVWDLLRHQRPAFVVSMAVLVASLSAVIWWERSYDHPSDTGSAFDSTAVPAFQARAFNLVREGVGDFGWLDTPAPRWVVLAWILLAVVAVGTAILVGSAADRWSLAGWLVALVLVAYVTYATVFYPIQAGLQGRHLLPFFMFCPLLAGAVLVEKLGSLDPSALRRLFRLTALVLPVIQFASIYANARRYAVADKGPWWFLDAAQWRPAWGWVAWLSIAAAGALVLSSVVMIFGSGSPSPSAERRVHVEG
jgi:hypothetical protein